VSPLPPDADDDELNDGDEADAAAPPRLADPLREAKMQVARAVARRRRSAIEALMDRT